MRKAPNPLIRLKEGLQGDTHQPCGYVTRIPGGIEGINEYTITTEATEKYNEKSVIKTPMITRHMVWSGAYVVLAQEYGYNMAAGTINDPGFTQEATRVRWLYPGNLDENTSLFRYLETGYTFVEWTALHSGTVFICASNGDERAVFRFSAAGAYLGKTSLGSTDFLEYSSVVSGEYIVARDSTNHQVIVYRVNGDDLVYHRTIRMSGSMSSGGMMWNQHCPGSPWAPCRDSLEGSTPFTESSPLNDVVGLTPVGFPDGMITICTNYVALPGHPYVGCGNENVGSTAAYAKFRLSDGRLLSGGFAEGTDSHGQFWPNMWVTGNGGMLTSNGIPFGSMVMGAAGGVGYRTSGTANIPMTRIYGRNVIGNSLIYMGYGPNCFFQLTREIYMGPVAAFGNAWDLTFSGNGMFVTASPEIHQWRYSDFQEFSLGYGKTTTYTIDKVLNQGTDYRTMTRELFGTEINPVWPFEKGDFEASSDSPVWPFEKQKNTF